MGLCAIPFERYFRCQRCWTWQIINLLSRICCQRFNVHLCVICLTSEHQADDLHRYGRFAVCSEGASKQISSGLYQTHTSIEYMVFQFSRQIFVVLCSNSVDIANFINYNPTELFLLIRLWYNVRILCVHCHSEFFIIQQILVCRCRVLWMCRLCSITDEYQPFETKAV